MVIKFVNIIKVIFYIILIMKSSFINLEKRFENKKNVMEFNKLKEEISTYNKFTELKETPYNIDSRFRNKIPKNILNNEITRLSNNPLSFTNNSDEMKIFIPNHNFKIRDRIILENCEAKELTIDNGIILLKNLDFAIIRFKNHDIVESNNSQKVNIVSLSNNNIEFYGNVPSNSLYGLKNIYLLSEIEDKQIILDSLNIEEEDFNQNYFFIKLPFKYNNHSINDNFNDLTELFYVNNITKFNLLNIASIPIQYINANFPINQNRYIGFHQIERIDKNNIYIKLKLKSNKSIGDLGGDKIKICKILRSVEGYNESNEYKINLKRTFNNVISIGLLSTEFNHIEKLVYESGSYKNNKLYWQNLEDGDKIYSISLEEGNYTDTNLIDTIKNKMNQTLRVNRFNDIKIYNLFDVEMNYDINKIIFKCYKEDFLPNSFSVSTEIIDNITYYLITIKHSTNFVEVNDEIEISGSEDLHNIPKFVINKKHKVYKVNKDELSYTIILEPFIPLEQFKEGYGGDSIKVKSKTLFRLLLNYNDTLGEVLGFKYVGKENSITNYSHIVTNKDDYEFSNLFDPVGLKNKNNNNISLRSNNMYFFMHLNDYESVISNTPDGSCFAKILLHEDDNNCCYINTFVNSPIVFEQPILNLSELKIKFTYADGTKPNFNNLNHSFTLLIVEELEKHKSIRNKVNNDFINSLINYDETIE